MRFEVVDGVEGLVVQNRESAGGEGSDQEGTEEAGSVGDGNIIDVGPGVVSVVESLMESGEDGFEMRTGGDFGDDAAVSLKDVDLGVDDVGLEVEMGVLRDGF